MKTAPLERNSDLGERQSVSGRSNGSALSVEAQGGGSGRSLEYLK